MIFLLAVPYFAANDILLADFEQATYGAWQTQGTAFGMGPAQGTLPNQMVVSGYMGHGLANSYVGGDEATGSVTSPKFKIERRFINFLVGGGYRPGEACIDLLVDGKVIFSTTGKSITPQDTESLSWASWDVSKLVGKDAVIRLLDAAKGGWGHINVDEIIESDSRKGDLPLKPEPLYHERFRPQFHFTAQKNWLNDPNGLVYADGEYHLFFQHNPTGIQWGNMHWGHAVSPDLFHWKELPIALSPDEHGTNYSGSAVLDTTNSSGLGENGKPPLVALYTAAGNPAIQCLAFSNDRGRTWTLYSGNPVLKHIVGGNRDPKVFWHAPTHSWVMALYLDGDQYGIFSSPDLKSWKELSRLHVPGSSECPELFEMTVEGTQTKKWIFYGGNYHYMIGEFDGVTFTPESKPIQGDFGANFYASQTYNQTPDGRRIQIGWMNGTGPMPGMPFNQQMSLPCELKLVQFHGRLLIARYPVKEFEGLRGPGLRLTNEPLQEGSLVPLNIQGGLYDLHATFHVGNFGKFGFEVDSQEILLDAAKQTITALGQVAPINLASGKIDIRIVVDRSSIEVFANGGLVSMTSYFSPHSKEVGISIFSKEGSVHLERLEAFQLKSVWPKQ